MIRSRSVRVMNQFNIHGLDWKFTLTRSMHRSRALNLVVDGFHTNNTLIYSYGLLYNVARYKHLNVHCILVQSLVFIDRPQFVSCCVVKYQPLK